MRFGLVTLAIPSIRILGASGVYVLFSNYKITERRYVSAES